MPVFRLLADEFEGYDPVEEDLWNFAGNTGP